MDLRMPVMDGYEATKQIKSQIKRQLKAQKTVIIALTASAFEEERATALAAGCDDFIRKPFREEEIFEKMAHYLGVRYRYESLVLPAKSDAPQSDASTAALLLLERMPAEWREQLHQAVTQVDAEHIVQLTQQIPSEYSTLALAISDLANRYRFDQIVELTLDQIVELTLSQAYSDEECRMNSPGVSKDDILIVDDTPDNLRLLSSTLMERGYKVRSVINGAIALMGAQAAPPDLIMLDIKRPDMDGYEVCQRLKENQKTK